MISASGCALTKKNTSLENLIREAATDPYQFNEMVSAWNAYFEDGKFGISSSAREIESAANATLFAITNEIEKDIVWPRMRRLLDSFSHPAFVARADGKVVAVNHTMERKFGLDPSDSIAALKLTKTDGQPFEEAIRQACDRPNSENSVTIMTCLDEADLPLTIACIRSQQANDRVATLLVFLIDPVWHASAPTIFADAFGLTHSETEILMGFFEGKPLSVIAKQRARSLATVRTQFHTVMTKMDVSTQAELMRNAMALSQFLGEVEAIGDVAAHPFRRSVNLLRPQGRTVEAVLSGAQKGKVVVSLSDITRYTFPASLEAKFRDANLCVVSLCRPGIGSTSPPAENTSYEDCLAGDIVAILDQLDVQKAKLWAHNLGSAVGFRMTNLISDRLEELVVLSTLVPAPFQDASKTGAPWTAAIMRAVKKSLTLQRLIVHTGVRAWKLLGTRKFNAVQLGSFPSDVTIAVRQDINKEFDFALKTALAQGIENSALDLGFAQSDWSQWVRDCAVPTILIHGTHDQVSNVETVRAFAKAFEQRVSLLEIEDAGFMAFVSHADIIISRLAR